MARSSESSLLSLHALRLKGFKPTADIAAVYALGEAETRAHLDQAAEAGFTLYRDGTHSGWTITPDGRAENERLLAAELDASGIRDTISAQYDTFLAMNQDMLRLCTDWQVRDAEANILNDHTDEAYDQGVIVRLTSLNDALRPVLVSTRDEFERFERYGPLFRSALERLLGGDRSWLTSPMIESYHTVWFELHEDFLATLGIDRASEGST
ncbi:MAG: transcriptional regulator [Actinomycetia bacterium]|nr:transcriptional regulator [Actinomycetes bacterium]MCP3909380.1 transcriptional regulator [Actinomycetes bacterium]